jgi:hypothetical protein
MEALNKSSNFFKIRNKTPEDNWISHKDIENF